jgi:uncharacterized protein YijF (DUF1287 family)
MRCVVYDCKDKATVFGPGCHGVCDDHARRAIREGEIDLHLDVHQQHHQRLQERRT